MSDLQHTSEAFFAAQKDGPDAIAVRKQEVKLTKFQSLPSDCQRQIYLDIEMQRPDQQKTVANSPLQVQVTSGEWPMTNPQSFLRHTSGANTIGNSNKWPWSAKTKISLEPTINSTTCESTTTTNINNNNNNSALVTLQQSREPFQVVWRRLSFEAPINTYDQLIVKALKGFRSLLPFQASRRHNVNNKDVGHCYPQTPSVHFEPTEDLRNSSHQLGSQKRLIFENLNGYVNSGEISAILGPSGAGKTSLLNAICGRVDNFRGSVQLIGGGKRRMRLSVIPQKDYLIENLTVRENLLYSSRILIIEKDFDHEANIMRVVRMLNLTSCFTSCVSNISGGEYKRVSIAQELLRQPDILILDEPTSGLDSLTCKKLIKSLTKLIEASILGTIQPIAIMMTIHQPDVEVFQMFDHVYCMGRRGRVIYDGHPSHTLDVIRSQSNLPAHMFPDPKESGRTINPANLLIEIASEELYGSEPVERLARYQRKQFELLSTVPVTSSTTIAATSHTVPSPIPGTELVLADERASPESGHHNHLYKAPLAIGSLFSAYHKSNSSLASAGSNMSPSHTHRSNSTSSLSSSMKPAKVDHLVRDKRLSSKSNHSGHLWHHTNILARRAFTASIRDPLMTMVSLIFHLSIPFVMWTVYPRQVGTVSACPMIQHEFDMVSMVSNNSLNKMADLQHQLIFAMECGTMFFITCYAFSMCSLAVSALAFPMNMHVLLKEVRNGWYSLPCYVVAKTIANFPFEVIFPVMSLVMIYLLLGMPESHMHWRLLAIALVMALIAMISHTNGFIFGALFMDSVQSAIFLSISSTLPLILLSGYTSRIKFMPQILQNLSWLSPYRYSSEAISIVRFGYGICPCDESTDEYLKNTAPTFADIPGQIRPLFSYYLANSGSGTPATTTTEEIVSTTLATTSLAENITAAIPTIANDTLTAIVNSTRPLIAKMIPGVTRELVLEGEARSEMLRKIESNEIDVFSHMADLMARSFSFGRHIESCKSVRSELLSTLGIPDDSHLQWAFGGLLVLLVVTKTMLFIAVKYKIGSRI